MMDRYTICQGRTRGRCGGTSLSATTAGVHRREPHEVLERIGDMSRCLRAAATQAYGSFEVGTTQAKFLRHIGRESRISQADLARATATAPTLTGRALETLVERGWVRRKRSEDDRRQYVLELTAAGRRVRDQVEETRTAIAARLAAALDARDVDDLDRIAGRILAAFQATPEEAPR